jgi:hypothetical protein
MKTGVEIMMAKALKDARKRHTLEMMLNSLMILLVLTAVNPQEVSAEGKKRKGESAEMVRKHAEEAFAALDREIAEMEMEREQTKTPEREKKRLPDRKKQNKDLYEDLPFIERYKNLVEGYDPGNLRDTATFSFSEMEMMEEMGTELTRLYENKDIKGVEELLFQWIKLQIEVLRKNGHEVAKEGKKSQYRIGNLLIHFEGKKDGVDAKLSFASAPEAFRQTVESMEFSFPKME